MGEQPKRFVQPSHYQLGGIGKSRLLRGMKAGQQRIDADGSRVTRVVMDIK